MRPMPWSYFFECWVLSQLFQSLLSLSSGVTLVHLYFLSSNFLFHTGLQLICNIVLVPGVQQDVVLSAYLRLLIFLPAIWIPASASSSPAFLMMYSAYKLNKQGDNIQPWHTPFLIWNQSLVTCPVLTVASWPAYRFLRRQVRWSGSPFSWRIFHSLSWPTQSKALV